MSRPRTPATVPTSTAPATTPVPSAAPARPTEPTTTAPRTMSAKVKLWICIVGVAVIVLLTVLLSSPSSAGSKSQGAKTTQAASEELPTELHPAYMKIVADESPDWNRSVKVPNCGLRLVYHPVTKDIEWQVRADSNPQKTSFALPPVNADRKRHIVVPGGSQYLQFRIMPGQRIVDGELTYWYTPNMDEPYSTVSTASN